MTICTTTSKRVVQPNNYIRLQNEYKPMAQLTSNPIFWKSWEKYADGYIIGSEH